MDIYGGVFNINDGAYGELNNSTFQNNIFYTTVSDTDWAVATGGAIHVQGNIIAGGTTYDASHIKINNSKLIGNGIIVSAADAWGGALYLEGVADTISNASFNQNLAKSTADGKNAHGGAIAVGGANTGRGTATIENLENTSFIGNQAISDKGESFGGALFVAADGVIKNITGGTFTGNIAQNGGAIYNLGQINQIKNTDFTTESDTIINETNAKIGTITNINMQAEFVNLGTVSAINSADSGSSYIKTMLNNGTIADISGSTTFGSLINSGLISGNNNSFIVEDGLGNTNTGTINANNITIKGGNSVNNGIITGTLKFLSENSGATFTNTNQIEYIADSAFGADASGVSLTNTGTIKNISNAAMEGILQNSGSISVSAADGGANILSAADIINAGELSFNNADYTGMLHNYKNFTLSGNNKLTGNITNQINAVLNLSDAAEIIGNFENNGITNVTGTLTATDTVNNGNLNFNNVVYNGNLHNNTLLSISGATETTGGIISNESQITVNNGAELNIAGGINNSGLILNNGTLLIAGNSQNSGFISGNVTIGNGQAADFDNSGFIKTKNLRQSVCAKFGLV